MKDWKTTLSGLLAGLPVIFSQVSQVLPPKWAATFSGIGMVLVAWFAKDKAA